MTSMGLKIYVYRLIGYALDVSDLVAAKTQEVVVVDDLEGPRFWYQLVVEDQVCLVGY